MKGFGLTEKIENYNSILKEIDDALGVDSPPAIEYIYVTPFPKWKIFGIGFGSPYGHSAVRFTLPSGKQIVMNIVKNKDGKKMVNFVDAAEYFFGVDSFENGAEQGGIYNRTMVGVRIENYPDEKVKDLEYFFSRLQRLDQEDKVSFNFAIGPIMNFVKNRLPIELAWAEQGNCARWTSAGLEFAGLMGYKSMWPKTIWIRLFEGIGRKNPENVNVVVYKRADHAKHLYGIKEPKEPKTFFNRDGSSPLSPLWNWSYFDMDKFANATVEIPCDTRNAIVTRYDPVCKPSFWRYRKSEMMLGTFATTFAAFKLIKRFRFK